MKNTFHIVAAMIIMCLCSLCMTSCSEKMRAMRDLEKLSVEVKQNGDIYGVAEWKEVYVQYRDINEVINQHYDEYSVQQRNRIQKARKDIKCTAWVTAHKKLDKYPVLKRLLISYFDLSIINLAEPVEIK